VTKKRVFLNHPCLLPPFVDSIVRRSSEAATPFLTYGAEADLPRRGAQSSGEASRAPGGDGHGRAERRAEGRAGAAAAALARGGFICR
jgi:hypothetical protein